MTKDYLFSLPKEQQDEILGVTPEDAGVDADYEAWLDSRDAEADEADREWAQALTDEEEA